MCAMYGCEVEAKADPIDPSSRSFRVTARQRLLPAAERLVPCVPVFIIPLDIETQRKFPTSPRSATTQEQKQTKDERDEGPQAHRSVRDLLHPGVGTEPEVPEVAAHLLHLSLNLFHLLLDRFRIQTLETVLNLLGKGRIGGLSLLRALQHLP